MSYMVKLPDEASIRRADPEALQHSISQSRKAIESFHKAIESEKKKARLYAVIDEIRAGRLTRKEARAQNPDLDMVPTERDCKDADEERLKAGVATMQRDRALLAAKIEEEERKIVLYQNVYQRRQEMVRAEEEAKRKALAEGKPYVEIDWGGGNGQSEG